MAPMILVVSVFVLGTAIVAGLCLGVVNLPGYLAQRRLQARLGELNSIDEPAAEDGGDLVKERHAGPLPALDRLAGGTTRGLSLTRWVDQSGVRISLSGLLVASLVCALAFGFLLSAVTKMQIGWIIGGGMGLVTPFLYVKVKRTRRFRAATSRD